MEEDIDWFGYDPAEVFGAGAFIAGGAVGSGPFYAAGYYSSGLPSAAAYATGITNGCRF